MISRCFASSPWRKTGAGGHPCKYCMIPYIVDILLDFVFVILLFDILFDFVLTVLIINILFWPLILNVNFRALFSLSILQRLQLQCSTLTIDSQCEYQSIIFTHLWCGSDNENYLKIKFWKCIASYRSSFRLSDFYLLPKTILFPCLCFFLHL